VDFEIPESPQYTYQLRFSQDDVLVERSDVKMKDEWTLKSRKVPSVLLS